MSKNKIENSTDSNSAETQAIKEYLDPKYERMFEVGKHWVFFIPPSWLIGGTVSAESATRVTLTDAVYLENVTEGSTNVGTVPMAKTAAEQLAASSESHAMPDGTRILKETILMDMPSEISFKALGRRHAADAIRKAR